MPYRYRKCQNCGEVFEGKFSLCSSCRTAELGPLPDFDFSDRIGTPLNPGSFEDDPFYSLDDEEFLHC